mmetsp:Transcript_33403/g.70180  ORF Transcript_33403/g.70180 Transcript_33403/m.70180 type:complete len:206 (+) Transcript_33403:730-1347(+)
MSDVSFGSDADVSLAVSHDVVDSSFPIGTLLVEPEEYGEGDWRTITGCFPPFSCSAPPPPPPVSSFSSAPFIFDDEKRCSGNNSGCNNMRLTNVASIISMVCSFKEMRPTFSRLSNNKRLSCMFAVRFWMVLRNRFCSPTLLAAFFRFFFSLSEAEDDLLVFGANNVEDDFLAGNFVLSMVTVVVGAVVFSSLLSSSRACTIPST